jgi:hypothetical protein
LELYLFLPFVLAWDDLYLYCAKGDAVSVVDGVGHDLAFNGDTPLHPTYRNSSHNLVLVK